MVEKVAYFPSNAPTEFLRCADIVVTNGSNTPELVLSINLMPVGNRLPRPLYARKRDYEAK